MEPVEVVARWDPAGRAYPQRFTWQGQTYPVDSTGRRWRDEAGEHILCMATGGDVYELVYHFREERWSLAPRPLRPGKA